MNKRRVEEGGCEKLGWGGECMSVDTVAGYSMTLLPPPGVPFPQGQPYVDFPSYILRNHIFKNVTFGQMCKRSSAHILSNTS